MSTNVFPRQARITDVKWHQFSSHLMQMGLAGQEFHVVDADKSQVVVDPRDLSRPKDGPFTLRRDVVEFLDS